MLSDSRKQLQQVFILETEENLAEMERVLLQLEGRPVANEEMLFSMLRAAHTLKGNSAAMGYEGISQVAHAFEDSVERLRAGSLTLSTALATRLLEVVDGLRTQVRAVSEKGADQPPNRRLLDRMAEVEVVGEATDTPAAKEGSKKGRRKETAEPIPQDASGASFEAPLASGAASGAGLRVGVDRLNRLLDLTGEFAIAQGRVNALLGSQLLADPALASALWQLSQLQGEIQEQVMQARMVPLGPGFERQVRTVRDLALKYGKQANLVIECQDVEVDTSIAEQLRDPLVHMLRNAVDHGLEMPKARIAAGKHPTGRITIRAFHVTGHVVIELSDDGPGLDKDKILARAVERGLVPAGTAMTEQEIFQLIFEPGFSTAKSVTELSGRGVGMDVVRRHVRALRGTIAIRSELGSGTTFTLRLPLTVAIISGFTVGVGDERYVIPMEAVEECVDLPSEERDDTGESGLLSLRGEPLPYIRLRNVFSLNGTVSDRPSVVVLQSDGARIGLVVDELFGETTAVVKPLSGFLQAIPGVAGSTILGSGRVAFILNVPALMERAVAGAGTET